MRTDTFEKGSNQEAKCGDSWRMTKHCQVDKVGSASLVLSLTFVNKNVGGRAPVLSYKLDDFSLIFTLLLLVVFLVLCLPSFQGITIFLCSIWVLGLLDLVRLPGCANICCHHHHVAALAWCGSL